MTSTPGIRVDRSTGTREEVAFLGEPAEMFAVTHLPAGDPVAGVVVCPTIHAEIFRSYRKEVLIGRELAAAGIAVLRFHYRGTGNSQGDPDTVTIGAMAESTHEVADLLRRRTGVERIGYLGTRVGAIPAVEAADPGAPLLLWDPVADGRAYLNEVFRNHHIAALKGQQQEPVAAMLERLQDEGAVEVLGYQLTRTLYDSLFERRLTEAAPSGPVRVVPFGAGTRVRALVDRWRQAGVEVTVPDESYNGAWWLVSVETTSEDGAESTLGLVADGASWLTDRLTG